MKRINVFTLLFALLLVLQLPYRKKVRELYPMIVLPKGAGLRAHDADAILVRTWRATAHLSDGDSTVISPAALFPESPEQYHREMYGSLSREMASDSGQAAVTWIREHAGPEAAAADISSVCLHSVSERHEIPSGDVKVRYLNSTCRDAEEEVP